MLLAAVVINEFMPNPQDEKLEWIEIQNTASEQIDISEYQIDDEPNAGSKPYTIPTGTILAPLNKTRFYKSQTNIALNNSKQKDQPFADKVRLLDKSGVEIDSITYSDTNTDIPIGHSTPTPQTTPTPSVSPPTLIPTRAPTQKIENSPTREMPTVTQKQYPPLPSAVVLAATIQEDRPQNNKPTAPKKGFFGWIVIAVGAVITVVSLVLTRYTNKE